jgi:hypothetical protein
MTTRNIDAGNAKSNGHEGMFSMLPVVLPLKIADANSGIDAYNVTPAQTMTNNNENR